MRMKIKNQPKEKKLPAIWWHEGAGQYACKIGFQVYNRASGRTRDRSFQLLGADYQEAVGRCLALLKDWRWTVEFFKTSRPGDKPVWLEEKVMRAYQAAERGDINHAYENGPLGQADEPFGQFLSAMHHAIYVYQHFRDEVRQTRKAGQ